MHMTVTRAITAISTEITSGRMDLHSLYVLMDDLRRQWNEEAVRWNDDPSADPRAVAVVAAVIDILAEETGRDRPEWTHHTDLAEPYFLWNAHSRAARTLVMMQTHPAFSTRRVFVPKNIMSRV